ncbi:2-succinyl-5-enolpyruvyl-6-hydroxy-3-cyclohexene-1-carboxylic-acid synthase [Nakamurella sp. YIM 132087]|uniref:2-succinyl-5-enolpyruvyl-6-hydroxy-3-cyclohexene-1-carboxylate synthase n=1 Tax=Nakamurella alba TaxID=2665158 RepID=A0A7K1FMD5_9ACTN|nr:2-succinyl-5-enolpyruvyl-6-hydroxy-3-cyclohexene-1-carboxylic-acid synthase [Nakamurella alba]MTD14479.1 2-succinyl-5-enolpyruvyl-6-hydroxy-3-cyclohexene-1-carboxylic-acid synthase [Nakamurella alba]
MNPSTALARVLVDELAAAGVTDVVLAPGSRNAPLSMALVDADTDGRLRLHVRTDERAAGFLAVGLARSSGRTTAVVTTSGTAVANLLPAVLEAHHGGVPLLVLTADRPPHLREVGANQVIDQRDVFGRSLRFFHEFGVPQRAPAQQAGWRSMVDRALAHSRGLGVGVPGPVQLNIPLVPPLLPDAAAGTGLDQAADWPEDLHGRADGPWTSIATEATEDVLSGLDVPAGRVPMIDAPAPGERVLFVGDLTHPAAGPLAALGHVVLSEAGGAAGASVLSAGAHLLDLPGFLEPALPDRVVVLGRPTLFRQFGKLLADSVVEVDVLAPQAGYSDPSGRARRVAPVLAPLAGPGEPDFVRTWQDAQRRAAAAVAGELAGWKLASSPRLAADVVAALPDGATLVLGSSQLPRDVGLAAAPRDGLRLIANRGVAGIDGTVSTAVGVALADPESPTVALMGDLTFLHDVTGLVIGPDEPRPDLTIVVSHNNGGGIFHTLEPGEERHASRFERVFGTPHGTDLGGFAEAAGWRHDVIEEPADLAALLSAPSGLRVLEIPTGRSDLRAEYARLRAAVHASVHV